MIQKLSRFSGIIIASAAAIAVATPTHADEGAKVQIERDVIFGEGELLDRLIKLDAAGIADMRAQMADAREDIEEAILEIEDAREELKDAPGGRLIVRVAFATARSAAKGAIEVAFVDARAEIDDAESKLATIDVSAEERVETQGAIDGLREDLAGIEETLRDLMAALTD